MLPLFVGDFIIIIGELANALIEVRKQLSVSERFECLAEKRVFLLQGMFEIPKELFLFNLILLLTHFEIQCHLIKELFHHQVDLLFIDLLSLNSFGFLIKIIALILLLLQRIENIILLNTLLTLVR